MVDFGFLKAYALDSFIRSAKPDAHMRLHLDGLMREVTSYTVCEHPSRRRAKAAACDRTQTVQPVTPPIKQP
jgi:hypothetical protein